MDVQIRFERENRDGIVAAGSYLIDAVKRLGIPLEGKCDLNENIHYCSMSITKGAEKLSPLTNLESEHFSTPGRRNNERLACQARIEKPGEVVIMTTEKKEEPKAETKNDPFQKEFAEMPLEKKIANLVRLEAITLGETFSFMINTPLKVFDKVGDVMAEFGMKLDREAKEAARPDEHKSDNAAGETKSKGRKAASRKRPKAT